MNSGKLNRSKIVGNELEYIKDLLVYGFNWNGVCDKLNEKYGTSEFKKNYTRLAFYRVKNNNK